MRAQQLFFSVTAGLVLTMAFNPQNASAQTWTPDPAPVLFPKSIQIGRGDRLTNGQGFTVVELDTVTLGATSVDFDTLTTGTTKKLVPDIAYIVWSSVPDKLVNDSRMEVKKPDIFTLFKAPMVPEGKDSLQVTVTARPDDKSEQNPGDDLGGFAGNRNDAPGEGVTITITVIKKCPDTIAIADRCAVTTDAAFWMANPAVRTAGGITTHMKVSGPNPPAAPGNWNGMYIKEKVRLYPNDEGTAKDADFTAGVRPDFVTSEGFIVGLGKPKIVNCDRPAAVDRFWDNHFVSGFDLGIKPGPDKTLIFEQQYLCGKTQLKTGGAKNQFKITYTFHNAEYPVIGRRVEVPATKVAE